MILRNLSARNIELRDTSNSSYIVPAYSDLTVDDSKWGDNIFRRWMRNRIRDLVIVSTTTGNPGDITLKGTLATRPAAGSPGRIYYVTDAGQQRWQRDTGTVWEEVPTLSMQGSTVTFGTSADVNLYRNAADSLVTDDALTARNGQSGHTLIGGNPNPGIWFGSGAEQTYLARTSTGWLQTDAGIQVGVNGLKFNDGSTMTGAAQAIPTGVIMVWSSGNAAPSGWLLCDGAAVSRTTYAALWGLWGTFYGAGNGSTTFNLPNLKGRIIAGVDAGQTEFATLGAVGGAKTHTLSLTEMAAHSHTVNAHNHGGGVHSHGVNDPTHAHTHQGTNGDSTHWGGGEWGERFGVNKVTTYNATGITIQNSSSFITSESPGTNSQGGGGAHNNLQPYMNMHYIVKT